jgi:hypothetical protein
VLRAEMSLQVHAQVAIGSAPPTVIYVILDVACYLCALTDSRCFVQGNSAVM